MKSLQKSYPDSGAYLNEVNIDEPHFQRSFWGLENHARLIATKRRVDPHGSSSSAASVSVASFGITLATAGAAIDIYTIHPSKHVYVFCFCMCHWSSNIINHSCVHLNLMRIIYHSSFAPVNNYKNFFTQVLETVHSHSVHVQGSVLIR